MSKSRTMFFSTLAIIGIVFGTATKIGSQSSESRELAAPSLRGFYVEDSKLIKDETLGDAYFMLLKKKEPWTSVLDRLVLENPGAKVTKSERLSLANVEISSSTVRIRMSIGPGNEFAETIESATRLESSATTVVFLSVWHL